MRDSLTMHWDAEREVWQVKGCNELVAECRVLVVETRPIKGWCAYERVERPYTMDDLRRSATVQSETATVDN